MSDKLKLGWTVSETIGMAIVNPRAVSALRGKFVFSSETGTLTITDLPVITGAVEGAALAFANDVLEAKMPANSTDLRIYRNREMLELIGVRRENSTYVLYYLEPDLFQGEDWVRFKAAVEKICNDLTIFI
jgi:hypothetical protein